MSEARKYWLENVMPAMSRLRDAAKDDASGIGPRDIQDVADAISGMSDALVDFEALIDDIE